MRDLGGDLWDEQLRLRLEGKLIELAFELLAAGRSCILDFGLWSREERDALRLRARRVGVRESCTSWTWSSPSWYTAPLSAMPTCPRPPPR